MEKRYLILSLVVLAACGKKSSAPSSGGEPAALSPGQALEVTVSVPPGKTATQVFEQFKINVQTECEGAKCDPAVGAFYNTTHIARTVKADGSEWENITFNTCSGFVVGKVDKDLIFATARHCLSEDQVKAGWGASCKAESGVLLNGLAEKLKCHSVWWLSKETGSDRDIAMIRLEGGTDKISAVSMNFNYRPKLDEKITVKGFDFRKKENGRPTFVAQECEVGPRTSIRGEGNQSLFELKNCAYGIRKGFSGSLVVNQFNEAIGVLAEALFEGVFDNNVMYKEALINAFFCLEKFSPEIGFATWFSRPECSVKSKN